MDEDKKKINTLEEALDFAISRESEAYDFYMELAASDENPSNRIEPPLGNSTMLHFKK